MNGPIIKWVSGQFRFIQFSCPAFETSPQIAPTDTSPLPKVTMTWPQTQSSTMNLFQASIHGLRHRY